MMELSVTGVSGSREQQQQRLPLPRQHAYSLDGKLPVLRDHSWDDTSQTSSASGYNESYSVLMMALESPLAPAGAPPLASPDMPSTSSAAPTTNYSLAEGSSPDSSINSATGEDTALLDHTERTLSQHSLLITFETQDEDTLI
ncbi:hypothetical protein PR048_032991 [Dryococelus australis]|uniref:Uncharacterized protein n=1 Tax=Dryococelus australis TaxID=614101 RepID=A0ABQ9G3T6_9NEOP|nr:hypothetical protein PR048_032991 [Dryococelus australis]